MNQIRYVISRKKNYPENAVKRSNKGQGGGGGAELLK